VRDFNKELEARTAERMGEAYRRTEQIIAGTPALRGSIEDRLLITDSRGQHKDRRSAKRLTAADIKELAVEAVEVPIAQPGDEYDFDYNNF
ncbi:MAG: hypothetical protein HDS87_02715, partial [Bacteroidales bacterium]|nr:hypothetical protein [Bacteroidales bacterium]